MFNFGVTMFYLLPILNMYSASLQLLGSVLGTYVIAKYMKGPAMPWVVFAYVYLLHLAVLVLILEQVHHDSSIREVSLFWNLAICQLFRPVSLATSFVRFIILAMKHLKSRALKWSWPWSSQPSHGMSGMVEDRLRYETFLLAMSETHFRGLQDLDKWQSEKKITKYPSLLEFLGFS